MRRGFRAEVVKDDDGQIYAINLGADFCAEHEWGIKELRSILGIPENEPPTGLSYHTAKRPCAENLFEFSGKKQHFILFSSGWKWCKEPEELAKIQKYYINGKAGELGFFTWRGNKEPKVISTAWSNNDFGIVIGKDADKELKEFGKKLVQAIKTGDFALWYSGTDGNPYANSGLVVGITSLVPESVKKYMEAAYDDLANLKKAAEATGVVETLKKNDKKYFACCPRWANEEKTEVMFWLNPQEQDKHNYGWYYPQDLLDWANDVAGNKIDKKQK